MKKFKVAIFQPVIPHYRVDFFLNLLNESDIEYVIFASEKEPSGLFSVEEIFNIESFQKLGKLKKNPVINTYWQSKISFNSIFNFDAIVISGNPRLMNHMILFFLCKIFGTKVIWWGQGWSANRRGLFSRFRRKLMHYADGIIVYTEKEASEIKTEKKIIGLNNGINIKPIKNAIFNTRAKKNNDSDTLYLVFIGRLTKKSEIHRLFEALLIVKRKITLSIVGNGPLLKKIKDFSNAEFFNNENIRVIFHDELYDPNEIAPILIYNDAFIYPGSVGLSLIHAFAHGLPDLIHNDASVHMPEFSAFKSGYNGLDIPKDTISLANFLERVSKTQLCLMRDNALSTVSNDYNTQSMAEKFNILIKGTIEK